MSERGEVAFGIAGWSYADWRGVVYPKGCRDTLRFCAQYVDCIEINTTFYRLPDARQADSWARRTADLPTFFTAKLPQVFTHELRLDPGDVAATRTGLAPLSDAGKLHALLAQFNFRFPSTPEHRAHLAALVAAFRRVAPIVVEVRHRSWQEGDALEFLAGLGVSIAHLDYPGARSGFNARLTGVHGDADLAYFRLHGRNAAAWFDHDADRDAVYDWHYAPAELDQLLARLGDIAQRASRTLVVGNNHFRGQELVVALQLAARWRKTKVAVPPLLLEHYGELAGIARGAGRGLFEGG